MLHDLSFTDVSLHKSACLSVSDCLRPIWLVSASGCYGLLLTYGNQLGLLLDNGSVACSLFPSVKLELRAVRQ